MDDLEPLIDALYAGSPADFTGTRDALATTLRTEGRHEEAERVRGLRRPTKLAADLNRLVGESPDRIAAVLQAEERLQGAQARMLAGEAGADDLRAAEVSEAQAISAFPGGPPIHAALRFAARSERQREDLRRGRLSRDPAPDDASSGLFALGPAVSAPGSATPATPAPRRDELADARSKRDARRAEEAKAADRAGHAAALEAARAALEAAGEREEAERLAAERDRLRTELSEVEAALSDRQRAAEEALTAVAAAEAEAAQAGAARLDAEGTARGLLEAPKAE